MTSQIQYNYTPNTGLPVKCLEFIKGVSGGREDVINLIRAIGYSLIMPFVPYQKFFYLIGPGGTGKSTLVNLFKTVVSPVRVLTTSLKNLNYDRFEIILMTNKKLISISDPDQYKGSTTVLKNMTGDDTMGGREKGIQGSTEVRCSGYVIVSANSDLAGREIQGELSRRVCYVDIEHKGFKPKSLIDIDTRGRISGELTNEMGSLFNWFFNMDPSLAEKIMRNPVGETPSIKSLNQELTKRLNTISDWVSQEIVSGKGTYVGVSVNGDPTKDPDYARRKTLYPAYQAFCYRNKLKCESVTEFGTQILGCLARNGFVCTKARKTKGMFVSGIEVNPIVFTVDFRYQSSLVKEAKNDVEMDENPDQASELISQQVLIHEKDMESREMILSSAESKKTWGRLKESFTQDYIELMSKDHPLKVELNKVSKRIASTLNVMYLVSQELQGKQNYSEAYKQRLETQFNKSLNKIIVGGLIPKGFKKMGLSPRIIPISYKHSLNSVNKSVRKELLRRCANYLEQKGYSLIDLDLRSCYTTVLVGLLPNVLAELRLAMNEGSLWDTIRSWMVEIGKEEAYDKSAVKVCVYSSFFGGGPKAMLDSIIDSECKKLGIKLNEFKQFPDYLEIEKRAQETASVMLRSPLIQDFRNASEILLERHKDQEFTVPTGEVYLINKRDWRNIYSYYLQGFEMALLGQASI